MLIKLGLWGGGLPSPIFSKSKQWQKLIKYATTLQFANCELGRDTN